jgi:hypothetical protein
VLDQAVHSLASSGYQQIHCVGGGSLWHTSSLKKVLLSGTAKLFGPADHQLAKMLLRRHFGNGYEIEVVEPSELPDDQNADTASKAKVAEKSGADAQPANGAFAALHA